MSFQKGYTPWNKKYDGPSGSKFCECGCKETIPEFDDRGRPLRFKYKHGNRGRKFPTLKHDQQFKKGQSAWNKGMKGYSNSGTFKAGYVGLRGEDNPNWRGGFIMRNGYRALMVDGKKMYVHRHVMEKKIGRKLLPSEHVHHLNHDKLDNRPENLEIIDPRAHSRYHAKKMWETRP